VRGDAGGLVDDDDVVVVVDDAEIGDGDRDDLRLAPVLPVDLEPRVGAAVALAQRAAVDPHAAGLGDLSGEGAGEPEELGERGIHADAVEPVGDGHAARRHVRPPRRGVRLVGILRPRAVEADADEHEQRDEIIIVTMNMSATL
jgi:hypothetical protein